MTWQRLKLWYAVLAGIPAWTVHLLTVSSLAREACIRPRTIDVMHGVTALCAAATVLAMVWCVPLARAGASDDDEGRQLESRLRFLGRLGILLGAINLMLILGEGSYVQLVRACA